MADDALLESLLSGEGDDGLLAGVAESLMYGDNPNATMTEEVFSGMLFEEAVDWGQLELYAEKHSVHRVDTLEDGDKEYVISNLKKFDITLIVRDRQTGTLSRAPIALKASLLYENSQSVRAGPDEVLLEGETEKTITNGRGTMTLKLGQRALSLHHDRQRFRIKIVPADAQLAASYPTLTCLSEPVRSVTKLQRSAPPARPRAPATGGASSSANGGGIAGGLAAAASAMPDVSDPSNSWGALGIAPSQPPQQPPPRSLPPVPRFEPAAAAASCNGAAGSSSSSSSAAARPAGGGTATERESLAAIVRQQKAQIEALSMQNEAIMAELARFRKEREQPR